MPLYIDVHFLSVMYLLCNTSESCSSLKVIISHCVKFNAFGGKHHYQNMTEMLNRNDKAYV